MASSQIDPQETAWKSLFDRVWIGLQQPNITVTVWNLHLDTAQRQRLGNDVEKLINSGCHAGRLWMSLHNVSKERSVLELGLRLNFLTSPECEYWTTYWDAKQLFRNQSANDAIDSKGLVLIQSGSPTAFWEAARIELEWVGLGALWTFMWELAVASRSDKWLNEIQFDDTVTWTALKNRCSRLKKQSAFPASLQARIHSPKDKGQRGYKLDLKPDSIHLFQQLNGEMKAFRRRR